MKKIFTLFSLIAVFVVAQAQNGEISGQVKDENGEGMISAAVELVDNNGVSTGRGTITDFDGNYSIKPLTPGKYNISFRYTSYATQIQQGVVVYADRATFIDIKLNPSATELGAVEIVSYKVPLIGDGLKNTVTAEEIANMPTKNITDIAATTAGAFQEDQGKGIQIKGGRDAGTQYYIDGVKVTGVPTLPASSLEQLQVITGGVPAKYGDLTGGIVNITTKGPAAQLNGSVEYQTSQGLDAYGFNLANVSLTGPLWKTKKKDKVPQKTIMGFFLAFEFLRQQDPDPSAIGVWQIKQSKLDSLRQNPLLKKETATGFNLAAENVTYKDMFKQKVKPNTVETNYRGTGRFDIRPADNITLSFGGSLSYRKYNDWIEKYTLFNAENNPLRTEFNWRVFGRFTHSIQAKQSDEEGSEAKKKKSSAFQNAFYSVQVDYEKFTAKYEDESHGFNPFNYGYIGKFQTKQSPSFEYGTFTKGNRTYEGYIQNGIQDTAVVFTPGDLNLYGTRFTQQYYELLDAQVNADGGYEVSGQNNLDYTTNLNQIRSYNGLVNGDRANLNYNIWYNTGRQYNGYGYTNLGGPNDGGGNNDQYRVRLEGAFDILKPGAPSRNKHSFEFGVEFEQRIQRAYSVSPLGLWDRARGLVNAHILALDTIPTFRINGVDYSYDDPSRPAFFFTDTILFDRAYGNNQAFFDKSLRKSLGLAENGTDFIDLDALTPDQLNLNMFSPDELLQNGASLVSYRGYDPYGNVLTKQPSFNDFFTKRSADGEYERPIAAFRPIYTAAYISDRFYFKDLTFNVGVRIDRFDANQKVLKDEFSLYATKTKAEATEFPSGNSITHPGNIGDNYYVYVDDAKNPTSIKGYRNGSTWYDTYGNELASGEKVVSAKGIQPYLKAPNVLIGDSTFDPNESFTDYKPKVIVMPRLQFQFNLTDRALFFAHYDILSQRPNSRVIMDPTQYLYFGSTGTFNNPNLKPERTIDFEFGFKQTVSKTSAITISAFYREFRDQVQLKKIINAYPNNYLTYANVDFGTTKGFSLDFDMRRTANFSAKVNYTMQFAEGTGSDDRTQLNIVNSNQPNFRSINALNYDARHTFNVSLTYSFADGKEYNGPTVKNKQILSNFGVSVQVAARSGTPYTAQTAATPEAIEGQPGRPISEGSINGTRKPWYFRLNARIWKDFTFVVNKKKEKKDDKRELALQIYLQVQNLIGSKNQVAVYRYTGVPGDDGYLSDPSSFSSIQTALNPQAYKDQYAAAVNSPNNYSTPRRIFLGAIFSF